MRISRLIGCLYILKFCLGMGVLDRKGTLERGKDADIIALDRDLNVRAVWAMGELVEGTNKLF